MLAVTSCEEQVQDLEQAVKVRARQVKALGERQTSIRLHRRRQQQVSTRSTL